jgi:hypothetical protein
MWDETQNLRTADLEVREQLNGLEKSWVIGHLVQHNGVSGALWRPQQRLRVEYDADVLGGVEILDLLQMCGLHARPARLSAASSAASRSGTVRPL